ncbi:hypothetical protein LCGC14_0916060 [marine sediment metagenome]|uniref:Uncharacterized protein n=1 Tax=marine sediment metagenome TaxID=412755 RepID=A0A0F9NS80_9ZZZZ
MLISQVLNLPEKTWTPDNDPVTAMLMSVGPSKNDQYGYKQKVVLKDDTQASTEITVQTKFADGLMTENMIGTTARWRCKWFGSQYQGNQIVGYTLDKMPQASTSQPAPPQAPQAPPTSPQQTNARNKPNGQPDWDAIAEGKVRHGVVCACLQSGKEPDIGACDYWVRYIIDGKAPLPPARKQMGDLLTKPTLNEEVPWEQS